MDMGLEGKVAIITGGSDGIGKAAALSMAKEGANVVIVARRQDVLDTELTMRKRKIPFTTGSPPLRAILEPSRAALRDPLATPIAGRQPPG